MVFSCLRRCFSSKSSSSTTYGRIHTPSPPRPIPILDEDFKRPEAAPPPLIPIFDEDLKWPEAVPPPAIAIFDEDFKWPEAAPPPLIPIFDEDFKRPEAAPPPAIPIFDEDFKRPEAVPPPAIPVFDEDFKRVEAALPQPIPTVDGVSDQIEAAPPRGVTISDNEDKKTSAVYRIENELRTINEEAATHCSFGPVGADIFRWEGVVVGPAFSCYDGGIFQLSIQFPSDYPSSPPFIKFLTKIFHPNIEEDGTIQIDILKENWSSALTIEKLMLSICSILSNPDLQYSINEASEMYLNNWLNYNEIAREWTKIYAMGN